MAQVANKQNMTIAIREYTDGQGQTKKVWKTIGELTTWDDGSQSFEVWGPTGSTTGQVFDKQDNNQQQAPQQQGGYNQPQQGYQQQQGGFAPQQNQMNQQQGNQNPPF
jgi:hypothetical protein